MFGKLNDFGALRPDLPIHPRGASSSRRQPPNHKEGTRLILPGSPCRHSKVPTCPFLSFSCYFLGCNYSRWTILSICNRWLGNKVEIISQLTQDQTLSLIIGGKHSRHFLVTPSTFTHLQGRLSTESLSRQALPPKKGPTLVLNLYL